MRNAPARLPTAMEEAFCRLPSTVTSTPLGTTIFRSLQRTVTNRTAPKRAPHKPR